MNKKIEAFTIQEMIVVLIVSSLVISISMVVLNLLQIQVINVKKGYATATEIRLFERILSNDFQLYDFSISNNTAEITGVSETGTIQYRFKTDFVLRNQDTLFVKVDEKTFYVDNIKVTSGVVDAIDMSINQKKRFFQKQKAASYYMKQVWLLK
jgi:competence protein ComGC